MRQTKHIDLAPPRWDQLYFQGLADSLTNLVTYALNQAALLHAPPRILDIGCGRGELLRSLVKCGYNAIGVDIEPASAFLAHQYGPVVIADFLSLERLFPPASFDVVIASHVLEHVENPRKAVDIMKCLSHRWIIVAVPNLLRPVNWFLRTPRYVNPGHLQGWDMHHLKTLLEKNCDLRIVRWWPDPVILSPLRRTFLLDTPPLRFLENKLLPIVTPQLANSLVVLCEKAVS